MNMRAQPLLRLLYFCLRISIITTLPLHTDAGKTEPVKSSSSTINSGSLQQRKIDNGRKKGASAPVTSANLKKIIQELEDTDYGSFGSWGNFVTRKNPRKQPLPKEDEDVEIVTIDDPPEQDLKIQTRMTLYKQDLTVRPILNELHKLHYSPRLINLQSTMKILVLVAGCCFLSYLSVVPRNAVVTEYNRMFKENLLRVGLSIIWPSILLWLIYGGKHADVNDVVNTLVFSMVCLYPIVCFVEFVFATIFRSLLARLLEPELFELFPDTPGIVLSWNMLHMGYLPQRITLFLFSLVNGCIVGPTVEEIAKLQMMRSMIALRSTKDPQDKDQPDGKGKDVSKMTCPVSVRAHIIYMLAISLGLRMADNIRRILLYTAPKDKYKTFFAICRSVFPVQELCGSLTALSIAEISLRANNDKNSRKWSWLPSILNIIWPAFVLHFMANFRGMKPLYVWSSKQPWEEIQLQALGAADDASPSALAIKICMNLIWFALLFRTLGVIIRRYVFLSRQFYIKLSELEMSYSAGLY